MIRQPLRSKRPAQQPVYDSTSRPAPVRGWNDRDPEAAMDPRYALKLENWFPETADVVLRPGAQNHVTGFPNAVRALMSYSSAAGGTANKLFAATDVGIYDVSLAGTVGASVQARTSGACLHTNFRTSGASYLVVVNGVDNLVHYDGTTWTSVATFNLPGGGTLNSNELSHVNVFARRLFFIRRNTLDFCYLNIDSIGGVIRIFPLGGVFNRGGRLVAMATWTLDSGDGADDFAVFITSEGQLAVYAGIAPNDANSWRKVGVYDIAPPLGSKCFLKYGGDLLYLSKGGVMPLSAILRADRVDFTAAISDTIRNSFVKAGAAYATNFGWDIQHILTKNLLLVNVPVVNGGQAEQYVMNTTTRAWAKVTGWDALCFERHNDRLYMGMSTKVAEAWIGSSDFGENITSIARGAFDYLGNRAQLKQWKLLRPIIKTAGSVSVDVALDVDFESSDAFGPTVFTPSGGATWNASLWNQAQWGGIPAPRLEWVTVAAQPGFCGAVRLRVTTKDATVRWSATDFAFERGNLGL